VKGMVSKGGGADQVPPSLPAPDADELDDAVNEEEDLDLEDVSPNRRNSYLSPTSNSQRRASITQEEMPISRPETAPLPASVTDNPRHKAWALFKEKQERKERREAKLLEKSAATLAKLSKWSLEKEVKAKKEEYEEKLKAEKRHLQHLEYQLLLQAITIIGSSVDLSGLIDLFPKPRIDNLKADAEAKRKAEQPPSETPPETEMQSTGENKNDSPTSSKTKPDAKPIEEASKATNSVGFGIMLTDTSGRQLAPTSGGDTLQFSVNIIPPSPRDGSGNKITLPTQLPDQPESKETDAGNPQDSSPIPRDTSLDHDGVKTPESDSVSLKKPGFGSFGPFEIRNLAHNRPFSPTNAHANSHKELPPPPPLESPVARETPKTKKEKKSKNKSPAVSPIKSPKPTAEEINRKATEVARQAVVQRHLEDTSMSPRNKLKKGQRKERNVVTSIIDTIVGTYQAGRDLVSAAEIVKSRQNSPCPEPQEEEPSEQSSESPPSLNSASIVSPLGFPGNRSLNHNAFRGDLDGSGPPPLSSASFPAGMLTSPLVNGLLPGGPSSSLSGLGAISMPLGAVSMPLASLSGGSRTLKSIGISPKNKQLQQTTPKAKPTTGLSGLLSTLQPQSNNPHLGPALGTLMLSSPTSPQNQSNTQPHHHHQQLMISSVPASPKSPLSQTSHLSREVSGTNPTSPKGPTSPKLHKEQRDMVMSYLKSREDPQTPLLNEDSLEDIPVMTPTKQYPTLLQEKSPEGDDDIRGEEDLILTEFEQRLAKGDWPASILGLETRGFQAQTLAPVQPLQRPASKDSVAKSSDQKEERGGRRKSLKGRKKSLADLELSEMQGPTRQRRKSRKSISGRGMSGFFGNTVNSPKSADQVSKTSKQSSDDPSKPVTKPTEEEWGDIILVEQGLWRFPEESTRRMTEKIKRAVEYLTRVDGPHGLNLPAPPTEESEETSVAVVPTPAQPQQDLSKHQQLLQQAANNVPSLQELAYLKRLRLLQSNFVKNLLHKRQRHWRTMKTIRELELESQKVSVLTKKCSSY